MTFHYTAGLEGIHPVLLFLIIAWTLAWKGVALWKSSKLNHKVWFVVLLVVNTVGILEIIYIFLFSKINMDKDLKKQTTKTAAKQTPALTKKVAKKKTTKKKKTRK